MIVQDEDPDVVRWGLNLLQIGESFSTNAYCSSSGTQNSDDYGGEYENERESHFDSMQSIVENDAMLAHALQEELSHLADAEASGASNVDRERLQASILAQDWLGPTPSSNGSFERKENDVSNLNSNVDEEHQQTSILADDWFGPIPSFNNSVERKEDDVSNVTEEHQQTSILAQDWFGSTSSNYSSGHEVVRGESDGIDPSSSCSSHVEKKNEVEDWLASLESDEFSALDGEVGKRLNQMVPIPHVPKINGDIPSADEAISDYQRLLDRLQVYDLVELKVTGDGNCQFRALSDQFYRSPEHHKFVRQQIVDQLKSHRDIYEGYVPMAYDDYLKDMARNHEWGDHVTLQAAADSYGVKIFVVTSFKDTCYIEILPNVQKSKRIIFLSFWAEVHYNSIYPEGDMPEYEQKRKRWWDFRSKH